MTIVNMLVVSGVSSLNSGFNSGDSSNSCSRNTISVLSLSHILALN